METNQEIIDWVKENNMFDFESILKKSKDKKQCRDVLKHFDISDELIDKFLYKKEINKSMLTKTEKDIIETLLEHNYYLTTTQVSQKAKVSWNTAYNHLTIFYKKEWINMKPRGNRKLWKAIIPYKQFYF